MSIGKYPEEIPNFYMANHLEALGLHEHIKMATRDLIGSPMLFDILNTTKEWFESHPFSVHTSPSTAPTKTSQSHQTVCGFFSKDSCMFGSNCRNYHPGFRQPDKLENDVHHEQEEALVCSDDVQVPNDAEIAARKGLHSEEKKEIMKKESMRTANDVISRIRWDPALPTEKFTIGYLDRFVGIIEKPFSAFSWEDLATVAPDVLAVPEHRIQYFKYLDVMVWDKTKMLDNMFGTRGGKRIQDVILAYSDHVPVGTRPHKHTS